MEGWWWRREESYGAKNGERTRNFIEEPGSSVYEVYEEACEVVLSYLQRSKKKFYNGR